MRVVLVVMTLAAVTFVAAGCGGDDGPSAAEWATEFCTSTREWGTEVERIVDDVDDLSSLSEELEEAVAAAREATNAYTDELRSIGAPDVGSPEEIETVLEDLADELDEETAEIEDAFDDATGLSGPATVGREVAASVAGMFTSLERTLEALGEEADEEFGQALDDVEACDDLAR